MPGIHLLGDYHVKLATLGMRLLQSTALIAINCSVAVAQDAEENADKNKEEDAVVVTGSRIRSDTFTSPVAIDVLLVEDAKIQGISDMGGLLQTVTAASGSSQVTSAVSNAFVSDGGLGTETIGLRGLAANRTLDLINGRRAGPSGTRGSVSSFDLNSLPLAGISRVDILKDGASSIYGSDAIAGVVNYITDKSDGGVIDFYAQAPQKGGGEEFRISGSYGKTFNKGRFRVTADYFKEEQLRRGDRSYLDCNEAYAFDAQGNRADVIDPRTGKYQCRDLLWGQVWIYDYAGSDSNIPNTFPYLAQYDYSGALAQYLPTYPTPTNSNQLRVPNGFFPIYYDQDDIDGLPAWNGITLGDFAPGLIDGDLARGLVNYDHPFQNKESLNPSVERYTFMADGDYQLTDSITAYGEFLFNRRVTKSDGYRQYWSYIYGEDAFGGTNTNPIAAGWGGNAQWFSPTAITDRNDQETTVTYLRFVAGLKGDFGDGILDGWSWDLYGQRSDSHGVYVADDIYADSINNYNFSLESCAGINGGMTTGSTGNGVTVAGRPCVDVPWFDPQLLAGNISKEVEDFLFLKTRGVTDYIQTTFEGFVTGDVYKLPAGNVSAAAGLYFQRDEIDDTPDDQLLAGNIWLSAGSVTRGSQDSKAIYGELVVPLLADKPMFENLTLSGSGRYTDITSKRTTGEKTGVDGFNYRASVDWQVVPQLRLRGTTGTSFRAPGLFEQFLGNEQSSARQGNIDPCIQWAQNLASGSINQTTANNCAADGIPDNYVGGAITAAVNRGGGFGVLKPETSQNYTVGAILTPSFADLSIAVDYFDITIKDEIDTLSAGQILAGCYNSENFATEPLCNLFTRNPPGNDAYRIVDVNATFINVNMQQNSGVDFTLQYGQETPIGHFDLTTQWTYQIRSRGLLLASDQIEDFNGELGEPKLTGFANITYDPGKNWRLRWNINYIGSTSNQARFDRNNPNPTLYGRPVTYKVTTETTIYHALSFEYVRENGWIIRGGVNNIFDEAPPAISRADSGNSPIRSQYDYLGRRGFINITKEFN